MNIHDYIFNSNMFFSYKPNNYDIVEFINISKDKKGYVYIRHPSDGNFCLETIIYNNFDIFKNFIILTSSKKLFSLFNDKNFNVRYFFKESDDILHKIKNKTFIFNDTKPNNFISCDPNNSKLILNDIVNKYNIHEFKRTKEFINILNTYRITIEPRRWSYNTTWQSLLVGNPLILNKNTTSFCDIFLNDNNYCICDLNNIIDFEKSIKIIKKYNRESIKTNFIEQIKIMNKEHESLKKEIYNNINNSKYLFPNKISEISYLKALF